MVRTKADCSGMKTTGSKAPRKIVSVPKAIQIPGTSSSSSASYSGGNTYNPQPTPGWQKEITKFFNKGTQTDDLTKSVGTSTDND